MKCATVLSSSFRLLFQEDTKNQSPTKPVQYRSLFYARTDIPSQSRHPLVELCRNRNSMNPTNVPNQSLLRSNTRHSTTNRIVVSANLENKWEGYWVPWILEREKSAKEEFVCSNNGDLSGVLKDLNHHLSSGSGYHTRRKDFVSFFSGFVQDPDPLWNLSYAVKNGTFLLLYS